MNITMDRGLYRWLKRELPAKGISSFINEAVRARLRSPKEVLDAAYQAASRDRTRRELAGEWDAADGESWLE